MIEKEIGGYKRTRYWKPEGLDDEKIRYMLGEVPDELREYLERERVTPEGLIAVAKMLGIKSGENMQYCLTVAEEKLTRAIYT